MNKKLLNFIAVLSKKECERFIQYLDFPLFNPNEKFAILFKGIVTHGPGFTLGEGDWERIFDEMWPGRDFDRAELRTKVSRLLGLLKSFLSLEELQQNPKQETLLCLAQLRKKGLQKPFEENALKLERQLDKQGRDTAEDNYIRYRIADESNSFYGQRQLREFDTSLQAKIENLDAYYLRIRLRESCEILNRHQVLNTDYQPGFFDNWILQLPLEDSLFEKVPTLLVYVQVFKCYRYPDNPEAFKQLRTLLARQAGLFYPEEARALYRHAQNYCIRRINIGKLRYREDLFALYVEQLESGVIFDQGELDHSDFKNMVTLALRLKKFEWAEAFMEKYRTVVSPDYQDNVYHFCNADMLYSKGQFGNAIRLLNEVSFTDIFYQLSSRTLLLKLYYEMEEEEGLHYALESFERFLRRNKSLARPRRDIYLSFINLCRRLSKLRERNPMLSQKEATERKLKFLNRVAASGRLVNSDWLKEKANKI